MNEIKRDELKQLIDSRQTLGADAPVLLIDVREPIEVQTYGSIPTSINIPMSIVEKEFPLPPEEFKNRYGKTISKDKKIVFYDRSGSRSEFVANHALKNGYVNVFNYKGGALEWADIDFNVKKY